MSIYELAQDALPCPFCGREDAHVRIAGEVSYVTCIECDADGPMVKGNRPEKAIELWNKRTSP